MVKIVFEAKKNGPDLSGSACQTKLNPKAARASGLFFNIIN